MTIDEKIKYIANHYGFENQSRQCMEECAELSQAVNKLWRATQGKAGKGKEVTEATENVIEEMADVMIMISQMQELFAIENETIEKVVEIKLNREIERIKQAS